jgi:hypothetical protein
VRGIDVLGKTVGGFRLGPFLARVGEACITKNDVDRNETKVTLKPNAPDRPVSFGNSRYSYLAK